MREKNDMTFCETKNKIKNVLVSQNAFVSLFLRGQTAGHLKPTVKVIFLMNETVGLSRFSCQSVSLNACQRFITLASDG